MLKSANLPTEFFLLLKSSILEDLMARLSGLLGLSLKLIRTKVKPIGVFEILIEIRDEWQV